MKNLKLNDTVKFRNEDYRVLTINVNLQSAFITAGKVLKNGKTSKNQVIVSVGKNLDNMCNWYKF